MIDISMYPEYHNCSGCMFWSTDRNPVYARIVNRPGKIQVAQCLASGAEEDAPCAETHYAEGYVFTPSTACCDAFRLDTDLEREIIDSLETYRELDLYMARQAV